VAVKENRERQEEREKQGDDDVMMEVGVEGGKVVKGA
jgi:hypothetical protein